MQFAFMDESGYSFDWKVNIGQQPYYVLSTVLIPADRLNEGYETLRGRIAARLPSSEETLGKGFEIKARDIATGAGWWESHNDERNHVRDLMLSFPREYGGVAIVVVIDKVAHFSQYAYPANPYMLALQYAMERLQRYLERIDQVAYCIYDQNKRLEENIQSSVSALTTEGSKVSYFSDHFGELTAYSYQISRVIELSFGSSKDSLGLQVADFFARMAYQYYRDGQPDPCGWWETLKASLDRRGGLPDGELIGCGLKVFPEPDDPKGDRES